MTTQPPSREALEDALAQLLLVQPRAVRVPGTSMTLAVSYTQRDLARIARAELLVRNLRACSY